MQITKALLHVTLGSLMVCSLVFAGAKDEALKLYNAQDYAKAYEIFNMLSESSPEDPELHFYLGRSALELKKYDDAVASFDRVLMLNPAHTRTHLEMARLYFETKQYELAQKELANVEKEKLPPHVHEKVLSLKQAIEEKRQKHTLSGVLILGWDYDTNIANDVGRGVTQNLLDSIQLSGNNQRKSAGLSQILALSHAYAIGEKKEWAWESNFLTYNKNMTQYSDKDILLFALASGPSLTIDTYKFSLLLGYDKIRLGSEAYLNTSTISLNTKKIISPTLMAEADITKKRNINVDDASTSDSDSMIYTIGLKQFLGDDPYLLSAYISYKDDKERDEKSAQYGVSLDEWSYKIEVSKELVKDLKGSVGYTYKDIGYKEYDTFFNLTRKDKEDYYSLGLTYAIDKESSISLGYAYTNHSSNNALNDYTKNVTSLSYMRSF